MKAPRFSYGRRATLGALGRVMPDRRHGRTLLAGLMMGWLGAAAFMMGGALRLVGEVWVPAASVAALCLLALRPAAVRLMRWAEVPRGDLVAAGGLLGAAPLLLIGSLYAQSDPIVDVHWRCGTGLLSLVFLAPFGFILFGGLSGLVAIAAFRRERRWLDALVRGAGLVAMAASALLVVASFARRAKHPDADHYLASLPVIATVPPVSGEPSEIRDATFRWQKTPIKVYDTTAGDYAIRRFCMDYGCDVYLAPAGIAWPQGGRPESYTLHVSTGESIVLRRDAESDILIAEPLYTPESAPRYVQRFAYTGPRLEPSEVTVRKLHASLSPPLGWSVGGAIGLLLALVCQLRSMGAKKRLSRLASAKAGLWSEKGWITFEDETQALRADQGGLVPGPVLVVFEGKGRGDAYRGEGPKGAVEILCGEREAHLMRARTHLAALDAFALASVVLTAMPLVAALIYGIVF